MSQSRSRSVLASVLPFWMASSPRLRPSAAHGGTSGLGRWLIASPQYAIAQSGSAATTASNALTLSG